jgi:hypothetical protein
MNIRRSVDQLVMTLEPVPRLATNSVRVARGKRTTTQARCHDNSITTTRIAARRPVSA